jgi:hypothetical protein
MLLPDPDEKKGPRIWGLEGGASDKTRWREATSPATIGVTHNKKY